MQVVDNQARFVLEAALWQGVLNLPLAPTTLAN